MSIANLPSRTPLGVFYRSKLGVFTNRPKVPKIEADGVGTASGLLTRTLYTAGGAGSCFSRRVDSPMGVMKFNPGIFCTAGGGGQAGLAHTASGPPSGNRDRSGMSFNLSASYPGATVAVLRVTITSFSSSSGFYTPRVYLSSTDDSALYSTVTKSSYDWDGHADSLLQTSSGELQIVGGTQELIIPFGRITGALGRRLSFLMVTSTELSGSGTFIVAADSEWNASFSLELR